MAYCVLKKRGNPNLIWVWDGFAEFGAEDNTIMNRVNFYGTNDEFVNIMIGFGYKIMV